VRDLRDREDEDEVVEQLQRRDPLLSVGWALEASHSLHAHRVAQRASYANLSCRGTTRGHYGDNTETGLYNASRDG
jgi:hypothetical protein